MRNVFFSVQNRSNNLLINAIQQTVENEKSSVKNERNPKCELMNEKRKRIKIKEHSNAISIVFLLLPSCRCSFPC